MEERVFRISPFRRLHQLHCDIKTSLLFFVVATWEKPFNPMYTTQRYPFLVGKRTVMAPMMHQMEQFSFGVDPQLNCSVLQMDYSGDTVAFFVLPGQGKMKQLEQALSSRTLRRWSRSLRKRWASVSVCSGLSQVMVHIQVWERDRDSGRWITASVKLDRLCVGP